MRKNRAGGWAFFVVLVGALLADGIMEAWGPVGFVAAAAVTAAAVTEMVSGPTSKEAGDHAEEADH